MQDKKHKRLTKLIHPLKRLSLLSTSQRRSVTLSPSSAAFRIKHIETRDSVINPNIFIINLCKLNLLSLSLSLHGSLVPEVVLQEVPEQVANDLISCLPHETAVAIFALLCFKDLISVQLVRNQPTPHMAGPFFLLRHTNLILFLIYQVCKSWRRIASDAALWRQLYVELSWRYPYLSLHRFVSDGVTWHQRFCRATTMANWSTGSVQKIQSFNEHVGRVLSTKLKDRFLVTLGEVCWLS